MTYERLGDRLAEADRGSYATLPDGSVDRYCTLAAGTDAPIRTRATLGHEISRGERSSFRMRVESVEPGGQAVNVAMQLHALGRRVTCYGHLDHEVFADLGFETVSMGQPATVHAFNLADSDVMLAENADMADWDLEDLEAVAGLESVFDVDVVSCGNWVSFPGMDDAFHRLADTDLPRVPFVFDPGDLVGMAPTGLASLRAAMAALQDTVDVILNANRQEIRALASTLESPPRADVEKLAAIREATGIHAAVMHATDVAAAATPEGLATVDSLRIEDPQRHTGGGDHFTGGLAVGLANDWDWSLALACGNSCAARYVETGTTGAREAIGRTAKQWAADGG